MCVALASFALATSTFLRDACYSKGASHWEIRCALQATFHDGEVVTWNKVTTTINNLILGKLYIEHGGVMRVQSDCTSTEVRCNYSVALWQAFACRTPPPGLA